MTVHFLVSDAKRVFERARAPRLIATVFALLAEWFDRPEGTPLPLGRLAVRGVTLGQALHCVRQLEAGRWLQFVGVAGEQRYLLGMPTWAATFAEKRRELTAAEAEAVALLFARPAAADHFVPVWPDPITEAA